MLAIVIFFNEARTDFLVVGPYRSYAEAEAGLVRERSRRSNSGYVSMDAYHMYHPVPEEVTT